MSTETSGFVFTFPEVTRAYKTSIRRNISSSLLGTILGRSMLLTIGTGIGVYLLHALLQNLLRSVSSMSTCFGILGVIIYPLIVVAGGYLIGVTVGKSAIKAKFPDAEKVGKLALGVGLLGYLAYLAMYMIFYYAPERFDHWVDYLRQAFYLLLFIGVAWGASTLKIEETPFCENCNDFMISDDIGEQNVSDGYKGLDIAQESIIINALNSRQFTKLNELNKNWSQDNYCLLRIWHCPVCNDNGFIDCTTHQSRTITASNGQIKRETTFRLIHSSHIDNKEIQMLMQARQILGTPIIKS